MIDFYKVLACTPDTVSDDDIKALKWYEEEMTYPPRFKFEISSAGTQIRNFQVKLTLDGLHEGSRNGPIVSTKLILGNEEIGE